MIWSTRFKQELLNEVKDYTYSSGYDNFLLLYDIKCVINHCTLLRNAGLIGNEDYIRIFLFLKTHNFISYKTLRCEDIHLGIESWIIDHLGSVGNTIRTARSRNDLTNTDLKLWFRDKVMCLINHLLSLISCILYRAIDFYNIPFPCFTHSQIAQPCIFAHYLLAYYEMFKRDIEKAKFFLHLHNTCPLGCCASVGTRFNINRHHLARMLNFSRACNNSLDGISDRDYIIDYLFVCSNIMLHISRFSEDMINYCSTPVGLINLSDAICTGSSLMPQKKNPDLFELLRSNACIVHGYLGTFINIMNKQPMTYNKDMQNDKVLSLACDRIITTSLNVLTRSINEIYVNIHQSYILITHHYSLATDMAETLTAGGVAYKRSHEIVSDVIKNLINHRITLSIQNLPELHKINCLYKDIFRDVELSNYMDFPSSTYVKNNQGNTSPLCVIQQINKSIEYIKHHMS